MNVIRLFLALMVLCSHCYPLALGVEAAKVPNFENALGYVAVDLFFFISGLLITASWLRSKSMNDFFRKRVLRIYPGFIAALLFSTIVMLAVNVSGLFRIVVSWQGLKSFIYGCVSLSSITLVGPEVFPHNPFPKCVNGSLWTIQSEFECYLMVGAIGLFCLFKFRWLALAAFIFVAATFCKAGLLGHDVSHLDRRFATFFLAGMCAWLWRDKIPMHWSIALMCFALLALVIFAGLPWLVIEPFTITYIILWLAYAKPLKATQWCDVTDLSYGVYLYAFPVQQLIALTTWGQNPWLMLLTAIPVTLAMAFASWHLVEKRFLNMKSTKFIERDPGVPAEVLLKDLQLKQAF